jgi:hypothetical protein
VIGTTASEFEFGNFFRANFISSSLHKKATHSSSFIVDLLCQNGEDTCRPVIIGL